MKFLKKQLYDLVHSLAVRWHRIDKCGLNFSRFIVLQVDSACLETQTYPFVLYRWYLKGNLKKKMEKPNISHTYMLWENHLKKHTKLTLTTIYYL